MEKLRLKNILEYYIKESFEIKERRKKKMSEKKKEEQDRMHLNMEEDFKELRSELTDKNKNKRFGNKRKEGSSFKKIFLPRKPKMKKTGGLIYNVNKYSLNRSQKKAVRAGLKSDFLCVEGPPGNGKSEMITGLLINAVLRDQKVLIASHNNKAVDAVNEKLQRMKIEGLFIRSGKSEVRDENVKEYRKIISKWQGSKYNFYKLWRILAVIFFFSYRVHKQLLKSKLKRNIKKEWYETAKSREKNGSVKSVINNYLIHVCYGWGVTNMSARGSFELEENMFDLLVVDEAAQCEIAPLLPLMYRAKRVVAVGDPHQLEPIRDVMDEEEREEYVNSFTDLNEAEKEEILKTESFFDLVRRKTKGESILLNEHYRCHPDIIQYNNQTFYNNRLKIKTDRNNFDKNKSGIFWINAKLNHSQDHHHINKEEIELTKKCLGIVTGKYGIDAKDIGIITPFKKQYERLNKEIDKNILCGTIHTFQGGEKDYILLNLCIHPGMKEGTKNWVDREKNMINVATSRAKKGLIIIADFEEAKNRKTYIKDLARYYEQLGRIVFRGCT
jgi:hypothetical protein